MVLVGPTGIQVIYASALKGVYRAKNDTWSVMDNRSHRFKPAQPNLIARTLLMTPRLKLIFPVRVSTLTTPNRCYSFPNPASTSIRSALPFVWCRPMGSTATFRVSCRTDRS